MNRRSVQKPFDICIKSENFPMTGLDHWRKNQLSIKRFSTKKRVWLIGIVFTAWVFFMLAVWSGELGNIAPKLSQRALNPFAPISTQPMDTDAGLVLLDIRTQQTAASLHVSEPGIYVLAVSRGSPASWADIHPGDCILQLNGEHVTDATELLFFLNGMSSSETAAILLRRESGLLTILYKAGLEDAQI